jgi:hypothetical protein
MKNIPNLLKILRQIIEMDWDTKNLNETFKSSENIYESF